MIAELPITEEDVEARHQTALDLDRRNAELNLRHAASRLRHGSTWQAFDLIGQALQRIRRLEDAADPLAAMTATAATSASPIDITTLAPHQFAIALPPGVYILTYKDGRRTLAAVLPAQSGKVDFVSCDDRCMYGWHTIATAELIKAESDLK